MQSDRNFFSENVRSAEGALRGMTFIEMIVGVAIMLVVFLAIFGAFQLSIMLVFTTKAKTGGVALVNEKMEYIRGLSYDAVGTVGGIPSGTLVQTETENLNGIAYTLHTFIAYRDDPADGTGDSDATGITADYKLVRVEADWTALNAPRSTFAETYIAPPGIETLGNGGTLRINTTDASANPLSGASVHITNTTLTPTIDVTVSSDSTGQVLLPGAPVGSGYHIVVSKSGDSTAQTYDTTAQNPNPNPANLSVVNGKTTSGTFAIDALASLIVSTFSPAAPGTFTDTFADQSKLSATTSATVSGGALVLDGAAGAYPASGSAYSFAVSPGALSSWDSLAWSASTSPAAGIVVRLYYWDGNAYSLVPDTALSGNEAGFTVSPVDVSALSVGTYGNLKMEADLSSSDPEWTPSILSWTLSYLAGPTPLPNVAFAIHGAKTVGTAQGGATIYKLDESDTTNAIGQWNINPLEWDTYSISLPGNSPYVIAEECPSTLAVSPGATGTVSLTLQNSSANNVRVVVVGNGAPVSGATVSLSGNGSQISSPCGQTFFGGLSSGTYSLSVSAPGYQNFSDPAVQISGATVYSAPLSQ